MYVVGSGYAIFEGKAMYEPSNGVVRERLCVLYITSLHVVSPRSIDTGEQAVSVSMEIDRGRGGV